MKKRYVEKLSEDIFRLLKNTTITSKDLNVVLNETIERKSWISSKNPIMHSGQNSLRKCTRVK